MNICIIGASSSLGVQVVKQSSTVYAQVFGTYQNHPFAPPTKNTRLYQCNLKDFVELPPDIIDVSYLVFCQGFLSGKTFGEYAPKEILDSININLTATLSVIDDFFVHDRFAPNAHICLVSSISAMQGSYDATYAAGKAGLIGIAKSLARSSFDVRANVIAPGLLKDSRMYKQMTKEDHQRHLDQTPTHQHTTLEQLAKLIVSIDKPEFNNMNGNVLNINGGRYV